MQKHNFTMHSGSPANQFQDCLYLMMDGETLFKVSKFNTNEAWLILVFTNVCFLCSRSSALFIQIRKNITQ